MYVIGVEGLITSMPAPVPPSKRPGLAGAHAPASAGLPPPAPPPKAVRRVNNGAIHVGGQRLKINQEYNGRTVAVIVEDDLFRVTYRDTEIGAFVRSDKSKPISFRRRQS
jgi:hypothetical protein